MAVRSNGRSLISGIVCGLVVTALVACGKSHPTAPLVATSNLTVSVSASTVGALVPASGSSATTFSYSSGFSGTNGTGGAAVNLTGATTVSIGGTAAAPTFQITNGGGTASGTLSFGSCDFHITTSTVQNLPVGTVLVVTPCNLTVNTSGQLSGSTTSVGVVLLLGGSTSVTATLPGVTIGSDGTVTVNGTNVGTVTVGASTGAG